MIDQEMPPAPKRKYSGEGEIEGGSNDGEQGTRVAVSMKEGESQRLCRRRGHRKRKQRGELGTTSSNKCKNQGKE